MINQYIRSVKLNKDKIDNFSNYPFCLPVIRSLDNLEFHPKVTFIVGENGSGKSTFLEAIAVSYGFNPEGGTRNFNFSSRDTHSELCNYVKLIKGIKTPKTGFFLRAESLYNVASNIDDLDREGGLGVPVIESYGGVSLHNQSHGESFFSIFMNRFSEQGIYILDEPEAALSPSRQMVLLSRIHDLTKQGCQFIIATHSPILMAYPHSVIYEIKDEIKMARYEETDHYTLTKSFLNNPRKMLDILMED